MDQSWIEAWFQSLKEAQKRLWSDEATIRFGVSFRDLKVQGRTTEDRYFNTFLTAPIAFFRSLLQSYGPKTTILYGIDGLAEKGDMLLVLGRPGSGCSTLLKTLAQETQGLYVDPQSKVNYEGVPPEILTNELRGSCVYSAETDVHFPELTVTETLLFSTTARTPLQTSKQHRTKYVAQMRDDVLSMFQLDQAANTKIGDEVQRGISGGEKRRVSIAETLTGWSSLQCWDNSTRGMDSSTALRIMKMLRSLTTHQKTTTIATLYQTPEPILDLFDKILVLYEGLEIFFGSKESAMAYFTRLGFHCPSKMTTSDFLTSLTNPTEAAGLVRSEVKLSPRTAEDFARLWARSDERKQLLVDILKFEEDRPVRNLPEKSFLRRSSYVLSPLAQIELCMRRGVRRIMSNLTLPISFVFGNAIMALIVGSVFYKLEDSASSIVTRSILIFYSVLLNSFMTGFEILSVWSQRKVVEKQARYNFYRPVADSLAALLCDIPTKFFTSLIFNTCLYFMTNLRRSVSAYFTFMLFSFVGMMTMSMFFRCVGSLARTITQTMVPFGVTVILFITYTGFVVPIRYMHGWARWIRFLNPISFSFESLMINEFRDRTFECSSFIPSGPGYMNLDENRKVCAVIGAARGQDLVSGDKYLTDTFQFHKSHIWRNLWILFLYMTGFFAIHLIASQIILASKPRGEVLLYARNNSSLRHSIKRSDEEISEQTTTKKHEIEAQDSRQLPRGLQNSQATIHWNKISYKITSAQKDRQVLSEISGWIKPGRLTALMGATGAGKTTLLDVLSQRTTGGNLSGEIYWNGRPCGTDFQRKTGYVQQQDIHCPTSTVRESLQFSAMMRQPPDVPMQEKLDYVEEIIRVLELTNISNAMVGETSQGLNVEQRKRLSIGVELASKPELLILDEPTSGLDSQTAWTICSLLQTLAHHGQAVICTIHQPSSVIFNMFDELLLIADRGRTLYFGDIGPDSQTVVSYFEQKGATPCRVDENPAEWLFEITSRDAATDYSQLWNTSAELSAVQNHINHFKANSAATTTPNIPDGNISQSTASGAGPSLFATSFFLQFKVLFVRDMIDYWRTPSYLWAKLVFCCGAALIISISCSNASRSLQGLQTLLFAIFLLFTNFSNLMQQILPVFSKRRILFEARERQSKMYSWPAFLLSAIVTEAVWQTIGSALAFTLFYFPIGMYDAQKHQDAALMWLFMWTFFLFTSTMSNLLIAGIDQVDTAVNIGQLIFYLILMFCGVLVPKSGLPNFWIFMYRVSPLTYLIAGMIAVGVGNAPIVCSDTELLDIMPPFNTTCEKYLGPYIGYAGGALINRDATDMCSYCPLSDASEFLDRFNIDYADRWFNFGIVWVFVLFNVVGTFVVYWLFRVPKGQRLEVSKSKDGRS
ncbi:hypothetical protein DM02DRAFT_529127 [Periconia macrospinosa]|uniref:ABC transporter domain-containing protein n=1 Tax=Periconia macrospinosa TaxID=97972 RepID=A0A2V1DMU1_9PLEO|nr:hypothetical protein DM02DRAFT_529127 [Periconia macrospinosa]